MALDEATMQLLTGMAAMGGSPLHELTPAEARAAGEGGPPPIIREMARVEDHTLQVEEGRNIRIRIFVPVPKPAGILVYFHGGGWVLGDIDQYTSLASMLAAGSKCAVALVEYRKAPEDPFPAAVDDAWASLQWVAASVNDIAGRGVPLIIGGDSSGGNLAAVVARRARDNGGPHVDLQVLIYPATDCEVESPSYVDPANQLLLNRETMMWFWDHYASPEHRSHPDASPLRATDLTGLPPAVVLLAEHDVLRSQGEAYARALAEAGVPVRLKVLEGQMHGFLNMVGLLPGSASGVDFLVHEIASRLNQ